MAKSFGQWLENKRRQRGWTQDDLEAASGTLQANISRLENEKTPVARLTPKTLEQLASALGSRKEAWIAAGRWPYDDVHAEEAVALIDLYRSLDKSHRFAVLKIMRDLTDAQSGMINDGGENDAEDVPNVP